MKYSRAAWNAERESWRSVIQLNVIRSIITIVETLQAEMDGDPIEVPRFNPAPALSTHSSNNSKTSAASISGAFAPYDPSRTAEMFTSAASVYSDTESILSSPRSGGGKASLSTALTGKHQVLKMRLGPLRRVETDLRRRLGASAEEEVERDVVGTAGGVLGPLSLEMDSQALASLPRREFSVPRLHEALERGLVRRPSAQNVRDHGYGPSSVDGDIDEATEIIASCLQDMKTLWTDEIVRAVLRKRKVRIEDAAGLSVTSFCHCLNWLILLIFSSASSMTLTVLHVGTMNHQTTMSCVPVYEH